MSQTITRKTAQDFRKKADTALKQVAKDMGLHFPGIGRITFAADNVRCRIELQALNESLQIHDARASIPSWWIGKKVRVRNSIFEVLSHDPSRPKYSFDTITNRGKRYRVPLSMLQSGIIV